MIGSHSTHRAARAALRPLLAAFLLGCLPAQQIGNSTEPNQSAPPVLRVSAESLLKNMPVNYGSRCSGVCLAIKLLLDGECSPEDCDDPTKLGQQIFAKAGSRERLHYRPRLLMDGDEKSIDARESLDRLGTIVTELYRARFTELLQTDAGKERLRKSAYSFLNSQAELDRILKDAVQQIEVFCGVGAREFADGTLKDTTHAFFIRRMSDGTRVVYDPNDPGHPIPCRLRSEENRLIVEWTCQYRDAKVLTSQSYYIVPREAYFRSFLDDRHENQSK
jgi:hypothetical protein